MGITSWREKLEERKREAEEKDAERRATKNNLPYLNLISVKVPTELKAMKLVPEEEARRAMIAPLQISRKTLAVAVFDPENKEAKLVINRLREDYEIHMTVVSMRSLTHAWGYYKYVVDESKEISGKVGIDDGRLQTIKSQTGSLQDLHKTLSDFKSVYISQVLEIILGGAIALDASDVHLEPSDNKGVLRVRVDGILHQVYDKFKPIEYKSLTTRIKLLSNLKINVTDAPQDGRFTIDLKDYDIEIRTSIIPSEFGETAVLRILDPKAIKTNLEDLGFRPDDLEIVREEIKKPNGLVLNTGPTGSGKTTTLYAFLRAVYSTEIKIITIEDPIEYHLEGISQTQIDSAANYTFASGLRSILRQDPDVILVGEIRDDETADIALNASLTGHLVFSTLHTNDAVGAVPRLMDLKVKPHILGPAVTLIIAQRLVRVLCLECKAPKKLGAKEEEVFKKLFQNLPDKVEKNKTENLQIFEPKGCEKCRGFGFKGRIGIFELIQINEKMEELIYKNPTEIDLKELARKQEMVTMQEDGLLKVAKGITSWSEIERATGGIK